MAERRVAQATGAGLAVLSGLVLLGQHQVRIVEAHVSALVQRVAGTHADAVGTAVIFPHGARWIGLSLNAGCTSALLMIPFGLVAGGLLVSGRLGTRRTLLSVAAAAAIVFTVNQLRIGAVALAMRAWGLQTGYDRSHVLLGSLVSTFGVAAGIVVFLAALSGPGRRPRRPASSTEPAEAP